MRERNRWTLLPHRFRSKWGNLRVYHTHNRAPALFYDSVPYHIPRLMSGSCQGLPRHRCLLRTISQRPHPQYSLCGQWQVSSTLLWGWRVHFGETDIEQEDTAGAQCRLMAATVLRYSFVSPLGVPEVPGGDLMGAGTKGLLFSAEKADGSMTCL